MSYATQTSSYRDMEIQAAAPERLVVIVFEHLVVNLERARIAMERRDVELRVTSLRRARGLVGELLATLDFEQGGAIATSWPTSTSTCCTNWWTSDSGAMWSRCGSW
jgi:flagellar protein FliS